MAQDLSVLDADEEAVMGELVEGARNLLRDFPKFFEVDLGPLNVTTVRLPHPLVEAHTLQVFYSTEDLTAKEDPEGHRPLIVAEVPSKDFTVDERNGLLKFGNTEYLNKRVVVGGYHNTWFLDGDLGFHVGHVLAEVAYGRDFDMANIPQVEKQVIEIGGIVHALWALGHRAVA